MGGVRLLAGRGRSHDGRRRGRLRISRDGRRGHHGRCRCRSRFRRRPGGLDRSRRDDRRRDGCRRRGRCSDGRSRRGRGRFGRRVAFGERGTHVGGVQVPQEQGRQERHREADTGPRELEEGEDRLEQRDARDDQREDPCPRLERPQTDGDEEPDDPGEDGEPAPEPDTLDSREVAERPEPVEAEDAQAEEQMTEAGQCSEEAEDRDQDGRVLHGAFLQHFRRPRQAGERASVAACVSSGGRRP